MLRTLNISLAGKHEKAVLTDVYYKITGEKKPIVIFAHGFKGFKDWGHWDLFARGFAQAGCVFIKFNFSHNGTTVDQPTEFADLEAFGENNFSKEYDDLGTVLDFVVDENFPVDKNELDLERIIVIGHSRGGPITLLRLANDPRVSAAITWASVARFDYAWTGDDFMEEWQNKGVYHVINGRTGQEMPLYWQLYEDYEAHRDLFDLEAQLASCNKPICIIHGDSDPAVPVKSARRLDEISPNSEIHIIHGGDHVFGGKHPFDSDKLPAPSTQVLLKSLEFIEQL